MKVSIKMLYALFFIFLILIGSISVGVDPMFAFVLSLWTLMVFYAFNNINERGMLFAFLIVFFVFLLGRDFVQQFFGYEVETFDLNTQRHTYISVILSLSAIFITYSLTTKNNVRKKRNIRNIYSTNYIYNIRKISLYIYYLSWIFAFISKLMIGRFVSSYGFTSFYTDYSEYLAGNKVLYLISKIELIMPVAWCIFLATCPKKKTIKIPLTLYIIYLIMSMVGTGQRSTALLGMSFLFIYFTYRNGLEPEEHWITKKMVLMGIIALPLIAVFVSAYSEWRETGSMTVSSFANGILDFFYDQGVTSNVIKRAYMYNDRIPNQVYILEFIHSGVLAKLLNIPVYHGNTVEHALYGGSFTHSLGYIVLGSTYLAGRGTGSCFIAELYKDFGYIGIFLGSALYGYILGRIANNRRNDSVFWMSIQLYIITQILWAIRGSFTGFISQLLAPTTIATYFFIFGFVKVWERSKRGKKVWNSTHKKNEMLTMESKGFE